MEKPYHARRGRGVSEDNKTVGTVEEESESEAIDLTRRETGWKNMADEGVRKNLLSELCIYQFG